METIKNAKANGYYANTVEGAINILYGTKRRTCIISTIDILKRHYLAEYIFHEIAERNKKTENINDQMLPNVYFWETTRFGIIPVYAAEISIDRFEDSACLLNPFGRYVYEALSDPTARKPLSGKALSTLAMIGYNITHKED